MKKIISSLVLLCLMAGCALGARGFPPTAGIANFDRVNSSLYRGGQPTNLGLEHLQRLGIKTIVNLRMPSDVWVAEEEQARQHGMVYTNVPLHGLGRPKAEDVTRILSMIEKSPSPVFVHCQHGCDRTGTIIACYRIKHDGWTSERALSEARLYGMSGWERGMKRFVRDFEKAQRQK